MGLGSNLGDRLTTLRTARERLAALPDVLELVASPVYETEPWGDADQPAYLNQVAALTLGPSWTPRRMLDA
ncbi:MAG: 2-amino-4-hydroxy-6-hydroxymethyldihydropteridine diphosphokinase, partial [Acidobacteriota bacterium]